MTAGGEPLDEQADAEAEAELERLRRVYAESLDAEERLTAALRAEQARSARLEADLARLRASEAFRVGHAAVMFGLAARRPRALLRRMRGRDELAAPVVRGLATGEEAGGRPAPNLFVVWGAGPDRVERVLERVTRLQQSLVDVVPLFLTDADDLAPFRRRGYPAEHVVGLAAWSRRRSPQEWGAYVAERIDDVLTEHGPGAVVVLDGSGGEAVLAEGVLNPLLLPGLREREDNLLPPRP
jgi:hypothetical protein